MFYDVSFTIPADTAEASPARQDVKLTHGILHRVEITFPGGCNGMVYLQIKEATHQVYPTNLEDSFKADNYTITFNDHYELFEEPFILTLVGWSPGTSYDHTLEVRFGILPSEVIMPEDTFFQRLKNLLKSGVQWHTSEKKAVVKEGTT